MSWVILAFGSVFFFTTLNLLQRTLAVDSKHPRAMALLFNSGAAAISILIYFLTGSFENLSLPTDPKAWITVLIASLCYGVFERERFVAAKLLDASVFTTVVNVSVLVAFVGSLLLYSESITVPKIAGGVLIIGSLFLVSWNKKILKSSSKGLIVALIISVMLGLGWMLDKMGMRYFSAGTYNIFVWTVPILFIVLPSIKLSQVKSELKLASWRVLLLAGLNVVGYLMQLKALSMADATRVIPIVQTSTLLTVLLGIVILKEKDLMVRKIAAGVMAIAGAYLLI